MIRTIPRKRAADRRVRAAPRALRLCADRRGAALPVAAAVAVAIILDGGAASVIGWLSRARRSKLGENFRAKEPP